MLNKCSKPNCCILLAIPDGSQRLFFVCQCCIAKWTLCISCPRHTSCSKNPDLCRLNILLNNGLGKLPAKFFLTYLHWILALTECGWNSARRYKRTRFPDRQYQSDLRRQLSLHPRRRPIHSIDNLRGNIHSFISKCDDASTRSAWQQFSWFHTATVHQLSCHLYFHSDNKRSRLGYQNRSQWLAKQSSLNRRRKLPGQTIQQQPPLGIHILHPGCVWRNHDVLWPICPPGWMLQSLSFFCTIRFLFKHRYLKECRRLNFKCLLVRLASGDKRSPHMVHCCL